MRLVGLNGLVGRRGQETNRFDGRDGNTDADSGVDSDAGSDADSDAGSDADSDADTDPCERFRY